MQNRSYKTKAIVEAGLISALLVVIMLINVYIPIFSVIGTFILPIPVTLLYLRQGFKVTIGSIVTSGILVAMLYNPLTALSSLIIYGLTGMALGYGIKNNKKVSRIIVILAGASAVGIISNILIYSFLIDKNGITGILTNTIETFKQSIIMVKELYRSIGMTEAQLSAVDEVTKILQVDFIAKLVPAFLVIMSFISAYINYVVTEMVLKKLRYEMEPVTPFSKIYIPNLLGAAMIAFVCLGIILTAYKVVPIGEYVRNSSYLILQYAFVLDGMAVLTYYLKEKFKISKVGIVLIVIFTLLSKVAAFYMVVGFVDLAIDFRKLDPNRVRKV